MWQPRFHHQHKSTVHHLVADRALRRRWNRARVAINTRRARGAINPQHALTFAEAIARRNCAKSSPASAWTPMRREGREPTEHRTRRARAEPVLRAIPACRSRSAQDAGASLGCPRARVVAVHQRPRAPRDVSATPRNRLSNRRARPSPTGAPRVGACARPARHIRVSFPNRYASPTRLGYAKPRRARPDGGAFAMRREATASSRRRAGRLGEMDGRRCRRCRPPTACRRRRRAGPASALPSNSVNRAVDSALNPRRGAVLRGHRRRRRALGREATRAKLLVAPARRRRMTSASASAVLGDGDGLRPPCRPHVEGVLERAREVRALDDPTSARLVRREGCEAPSRRSTPGPARLRSGDPKPPVLVRDPSRRRRPERGRVGLLPALR